MNYSQSLRFLNTFVDLEKLSKFPRNSFFNLKRMQHLFEAAGHPEKDFFPILIAGTTGKGSTGFFLESILKANGILTGYYHSPHVEDTKERIRVHGAMVSQKLWAEGLSVAQKLLREKPLPKSLGVLTYFEILTFLAIWIFAKKRVKVGVFEVGLGGRLDATNVLKAPVVILTPIHLDHEAFLGGTIAKIAAEKAAIIKPRGHIVIGQQCPDAFRVIRKAVQRNGGTLWRAKPVSGFSLGLFGDFQRGNAGVAVKAAEILQRHFNFPIIPENSKTGLRAKNWKGRMEVFYRGKKRFILDGAHNPISIKGLVVSLRGVTPTSGQRGNLLGAGSLCLARHDKKIRDPWLVFGAMNDKNSREMLRLLSGFFSKVILTGIAGNRAKPIATLVCEAKGLFKCVLTAQNAGEAMLLFRKASATDATAIVTGSFYLVGEARKFLKTSGNGKW